MGSISPQVTASKLDNSANWAKGPTTMPKPTNWIPIPKQPLYTTRKLRVVCIGAGYSGLTLAYNWKQDVAAHATLDMAIYEKNHDVGGTWLENQYPGVACDTSFYASGPEIWSYIRRTTDKYKLDKRIQFNSKVVSSIWDDIHGKWKLKIEQNGTIIRDKADVLISGTAFLPRGQVAQRLMGSDGGLGE